MPTLQGSFLFINCLQIYFGVGLTFNLLWCIMFTVVRRQPQFYKEGEVTRMRMSEAIRIIKKSALFKEWDGVKKPDASHVQLVYDFLYPEEEAPTARKEIREEINEFLSIIKGE